MIYGLNLSIPLEKVNSIEHSLGLMFGEITIYHGSGLNKIDMIDKKSVPVFIKAVEEMLERYKSSKNNKSDTGSVSIPNQIKQLSNLKIRVF